MLRLIDSPRIFDGIVVQRTSEFTLDSSVSLLEVEAGVRLPRDLRDASSERQAEYLAGRYCCKEALRVLSPALQPSDVRRGEDRAPVWPSGVLGTITHAAGIASVALAPSHLCRGLGIDTELLVSPRTAKELSGLVAGPEELNLLAHRLGLNCDSFAVTLALSAKESVFKCLYPTARTMFEFRDVTIVAADSHQSTLTLSVNVSFGNLIRAGHLINARFTNVRDRVYTGCIW